MDIDGSVVHRIGKNQTMAQATGYPVLLEAACKPMSLEQVCVDEGIIETSSLIDG